MPYSVLIVDDEMLIREGLRRHLDWATLDMEVIGVADGAERALEIARRRAPDILITDICMRSKTGFDLIEDLLELGLSPQVILISSYNDFSYAQRAVRLNVVREYILKPVDTDALSALLHKLRGELDLRPAPRRAEEDGGALRALALQCLSQALDGLCAMREAEGARLWADVEGRLDNVSALVDRVALRAPKVAQDYRERLQKAVEDALAGGEIDLARLTQEVALYSDRINIDEEIARMRSHVGAMRDALKSADPVGRQMDFIVQEMNREANTMGSKASDIELTSCVVNLKSEIEKIREQVQNIE